jgi:hypothetical protein
MVKKRSRRFCPVARIPALCGIRMSVCSSRRLSTVNRELAYSSFTIRGPPSAAHYVLPYFEVGITNSAPFSMLSGQRCMIDF